MDQAAEAAVRGAQAFADWLKAQPRYVKVAIYLLGSAAQGALVGCMGPCGVTVGLCKTSLALLESLVCIRTTRPAKGDHLPAGTLRRVPVYSEGGPGILLERAVLWDGDLMGRCACHMLKQQAAQSEWPYD